MAADFPICISRVVRGPGRATQASDIGRIAGGQKILFLRALGGVFGEGKGQVGSGQVWKGRIGSDHGSFFSFFILLSSLLHHMGGRVRIKDSSSLYASEPREPCSPTHTSMQLVGVLVFPPVFISYVLSSLPHRCTIFVAPLPPLFPLFNDAVFFPSLLSFQW